MGYSYIAKCKKCGHEFKVNDGGGFMFILLHCDKCGKERTVKISTIEKARFKKLEHNKPEEDFSYRKFAEKIVKPCKCGGKFTSDAKARCPKCNSDEYEELQDGMGICYD